MTICRLWSITYLGSFPSGASEQVAGTLTSRARANVACAAIGQRLLDRCFHLTDARSRLLHPLPAADRWAHCVDCASASLGVFNDLIASANYGGQVFDPTCAGLQERVVCAHQRIAKRLLNELSYAERGGAAIDFAGFVIGMKISLNSIVDCIPDKKAVRKRESALFAIECLTTVLGRMFEP